MHAEGVSPRTEIAHVKSFNVPLATGDPLAEKRADIVVAHWNRRDMLYQLLGSLPLTGLNVIIVRGNTYSKSNNLGVYASQSDNIIFCNDDMVVPVETINELLASPADLAMARQFYPDGKPQHCGLKWIDNDFFPVTEPAEVEIPTAACFLINRHTFVSLGGFDEDFINGGEDHDLFLRAMEKGFNFAFVETPVLHYSSQSSGRFNYEAKNFELFRQKWPTEKINKILSKETK